jgi:protease IV
VKLVKGAWKLLVGIKDGLVLAGMLLFFWALYGLLSATQNTAGGKDGALLLAFEGSIVEQPVQADPLAMLAGTTPAGREYRLAEVLHAIETAAKDDDIKTVVLDLDSFTGAGAVALDNVGEALDKVRAAKKPVLAYALGYYDDSYRLAAHASEVWLDPMGAALFAGSGGSRPYFKGLIDRLDVNVKVYRVGKFKSFVEPYTLTQQSPEAKAADQALVDALWSNWQAAVAKARPKARIAAYAADPAAAAGRSTTLANAALAAGLVDRLGDRVTFEKRVSEIAGKGGSGPDGRFNFSTLEQYSAANPPTTSGAAIGVVTVAGDIVDGEAGPGTAGGDSISKLIEEGLARNTLKALVVRVDSPGGSALASERIRIAVQEARSKGLPVVVSMGNVAASGGYWVAMGADKVFAEPSTITGSIGVFGVFPTFERTLSGYGVTTDGVRTTPLSGQPDILGGTNVQTDALIQAGVEDIYSRFLALVATSRKLPIDRVGEIAEGRVWDGGTARQLGLIDAFGSLDDAVADAAKRAELNPAKVHRVYLQPKPDFFASFFSPPARAPVRTDLFTRMVRRQQILLLAGLGDAERVLRGPAIQARCLQCPAEPRIHAAPAFLSTFQAKVISWLN